MKLLVVVAIIFLFSLAFVSAKLPSPILRDNSGWKVTHTTDAEYYIDNLSSEITDICVIDKNAKKIGDLINKNVYDKDKKILQIANKKDKTKDGSIKYGWCYTTKKGDKKITIGDNSTTFEWINSTLYVYQTGKMEIEPFSIDILFDNVKQNYPNMYWFTENQEVGVGIEFNANISNFTQRNNVTFRQNRLEQSNCENGFYYQNCEKSYVDYSRFESLNNITRKETNPNYPTLLQCVVERFPYLWQFYDCLSTPISYDITYYGNITDLDPELILTYSSTSLGFYNRTVATAQGINLSNANTTGDFSYYVYYNQTAVPWTATFGTSGTTSVQNLTLQTRTATSYNTSDANLVALYGLNGNANNEKGILNGTNSGASFNEANGTVGRGAYFDGKSFISLPSMVIGTSGTQSMWVKNPNNYGLVYVYLNTGWSPEYRIYSNASGYISVLCYDSDAYQFAMGGQGITGQWNHIAVTYTTNNANIYINGNLVATDTSTTCNLDGITEHKIGSYSAVNNNLTGGVDEFRIYNRSLSASEVQNLYNLGSYHIQWTGGADNWTTQNTIQNGVSQSVSASNFYQFKVLFASNGTNNFYLTNHTISLSPAGDTTPPNFSSGSPYNMTVNYNSPVIQQINATDNINISCFKVNDTTNFKINCSGYFQNNTLLSSATYFINVTVNDTSNNQVSQVFKVTVSPEIIVNINITNPLNITYNNSVSGFNISVNTNNNINNCWYSTDGGTNNISVQCGLDGTIDLTFENSFIGNCPRGWICTTTSGNPPAVANSTNNGGKSCGPAGEIVGNNYFNLGCDNDITEARTLNFTLPTGISYINLKQAGALDEGQGFKFIAYLASNDLELCSVTDTSQSDTLQDKNCTGLSSYAGQNIYLKVVDPASGAWRKAWYDNILLKDSSNNNLNPTYLVYNYTQNIDISNNSVGSHTWMYKVNASGTINQSYVTFSIVDLFYPTFSNMNFNYSNGSTYVLNRVYSANATILGSNGTAGIEFNGVNYTATNISNLFEATINELGAGDYPYYWWAYGNGTGHNYNVSDVYYYTIIKATPSLTFLANGGTDNLTLEYPTQVNMSAYADYGTVGLDNNEVDDLANNGLNQTLIPNEYIFRANITGNQNYSNVDYSYYNITIRDTTKPTWSNNKTDLTEGTTIGTAVYFNITFSDNYLGGVYIFQFYNGTAWVNNSASWTKDVEINVTKIINIANGYINWSWWFNDSLGNINQTDTWSQRIQSPPIVNILYPTNTTYTTLISEINYSAVFGLGGDSCWYSLNNGATNSTPTTPGTNFTGVGFVEGSNTAKVWCNGTGGMIGNSSRTFYIDLPPTLTILSPSASSSQNLVFNYSQSCSDTQGVSRQWYSWKNVNYTFTNNLDLYASAGNQTITAYCNDTYGSLVSLVRSFTTTATQLTNQTCPSGYASNGWYENGTIRCEYNYTETDPHWSANWTNIQVECPANMSVYGYYSNGTAKCRYINQTTGLNSANRTLQIAPVELEFNRDDSIILYSYCAYMNGTLCGNDITCSLTIFYPNKTLYLNRSLMSYENQGVFNYSLGYTNYSNNLIGKYSSSVSCSKTQLETEAFTWNVLNNYTNPIDVTPPILSAVIPLDTSYVRSNMDFQISSNENLSYCIMSLNDWANNLTMTINNTSRIANYTNSSMANGNYKVNYWCNDTSNNINNSLSVNFTLSVAIISSSGSTGGRVLETKDGNYNLDLLCERSIEFLSKNNYSEEEFKVLKNNLVIELGFGISDSFLKEFLSNANNTCSLPPSKIICQPDIERKILNFYDMDWYFPFFNVHLGETTCDILDFWKWTFKYKQNEEEYMFIGIKLWWILLVILIITIITIIYHNKLIEKIKEKL